MSGNRNDRRLIEDYLPIEAISAAASGEPRTKGHLSTLHVWRARRPLVACRAAVYGALVPASQFVPESSTDGKKLSLSRANAARFLQRLCVYPTPMRSVQDAQRHIAEAHASRLTLETGQTVPADDILAGRAPRPRILDMFAGGGSIPVEAARLGCDAYALDLNPVAHLIELCTADYPQRFGVELANDVEKWGRIVLERTFGQVKDVLALVAPSDGLASSSNQRRLKEDGESRNAKNLSVVAHYWTRTVSCPNPDCRGTVPLYRQTWLRKKASGYVALLPIPDIERREVSFRIVEATSEEGLGFDPGGGSEGSATECPFCRAPITGPYVRRYGDERGYGQQLMCVIVLNPEGSGKVYLADKRLAAGEEELQASAEQRARILEMELGSSSLDEAIPPTGNAGLATGNSYLYGVRVFRQAFTPRQRFVLLTMAREIRRVHGEICVEGADEARAKAITTYLGLWLSRLTDRFNSLARWDNSGEKVQSLTSMKRFAMTWDFPEINIFGGASGDAWGNLEYITAVIRQEGMFRNPCHVTRGSATDLPFEDAFFDAVITDPPYYDNESYSELSDVCYVWLRPTIGFLYPEHFAGALTPKRKECVAAAYRQGGKGAAREFYEHSLFRSLKEAHRVVKKGGILVVVYAHKTTLGWATLVEALRRAGFLISEAWPLDTETKARVAHRGDAALASSIFLVARKRDQATQGSYDDEVRPELEQIVRERVAALWDMGVSGADLVISCVGAGLRAFTRHARVEYANGEEVPAERFLAEVETVVLETILNRLSKEAGGNGSRQHSLAGVDPATRFYLLWRYTYKWGELDAGEAIVFANGTHVELDGPGSLSQGTRALVVKNKAKYRLRDFLERGDDERLGLPSEDGTPAPLVDALHRTLWLMEKRPQKLPEFLKESRVNREQMRLVAQVLAGPALKGGELGDVSPAAELSALGKLTANWRSVIDDADVAAPQREDRRRGQQTLFEKEGE